MTPDSYFTIAIPIMSVLIGHWFGDFVFQSDYMAKNKSSSWRVLSIHVFVYSVTLGIAAFVLLFATYPFCCMPIGRIYAILTQLATFAVVNAALHFFIDAITSRLTARLWAKGQVHNFFVLVGLDQLLHATCLILTLPLLPLWP